MRASYGTKSGPYAGSRASSPGEQAAACDYRKTRELGRERNCQRTRELGYARNWQKNSCAGLIARLPKRLVLEAGEFLEGVGAFGDEALAGADGVGDLGHVDVAAVVDPQAVGGDKVAWLGRVGAAPAQQDIALDVQDAQTRWLFRFDRPAAERLHACAPDDLANVDTLIRVDEDGLGRLHVDPRCQ